MIPLGLKIAVMVCKGIQLENNVRLKNKLKNEVKSTKPIRLKIPFLGRGATSVCRF